MEYHRREFFLTTPRIGFSQWNKNDGGLARVLWGNSDVTKYICASGRFSETDIAERLETEINNQTKSSVQYWPVFLRDTGVFIGCCGLRPYGGTSSVYEIGFHLRPEFWRKGLGREAALAVIEYAFTVLHADDLFAGHHPQNHGSAKMLAELGFHYIHDEYYEPTGLCHPSYRYVN